MNPTIYLSCLVFIIGSLAWTTSAEQDFESDGVRVIEVYGNADPASIGDSNVVLLLDFLDKYAERLRLTPEQRTKAADLVRQYREDKANQPLVDGVPPQGGWLTKLVRAIIVQLGIEIASEGVKKATGS